MPPNLFKRIVDEAAEHLPMALVLFFRGESLLHPKLLELTAYAKQKGLGPIQLASNAALLDRKMAKGLLDSGLDFISFSLDATDVQEYEQMRPGGDFLQVTHNVMRFIDMRDRGRYDCAIQVSAVKTDYNSQGLKHIRAYWQGRVERVRFYEEHSGDGHPGSLTSLPWIKGQQRKPCRKVFEEMAIYFNGEAALCNHDWFRKLSVGNANRQSIAEIWNGEAYEELRGQHLEPNLITSQPCHHCDHWIVSYLEPPFIGELFEKEGA